MRLNKKNKIIKLNNQIEKMFKMEKYDEIIEHLEDFSEVHKLVS